MDLDLSTVMSAETGKRDKHVHVQISKRNKIFLAREAKRQGVVMGLYLDKLLTAVREAKKK